MEVVKCSADKKKYSTEDAHCNLMLHLSTCPPLRLPIDLSTYLSCICHLSIHHPPITHPPASFLNYVSLRSLFWEEMASWSWVTLLQSFLANTLFAQKPPGMTRRRHARCHKPTPFQTPLPGVTPGDHRAGYRRL